MARTAAHGVAVDARGRVLIVEDDASTAEEATRVLGAAGYEVVWMANSAEAISALGRWTEAPYRYVLLDDVLPDGRGRDLVPMFHWVCPTALVVLMSAFAGTQRALDVMRHGSVLVPKPDLPGPWLDLVAFLEERCAADARLDSSASSVFVAVAAASFSALVLRPEGLATPEGLLKLRKGERTLLARLANARCEAVESTLLRHARHHDGGVGALHSQVRNLRRALGDYAWLVETVEGIGYRVVRELVVLDPIGVAPPPNDARTKHTGASALTLAWPEQARSRSTTGHTSCFASTTSPAS